LRFEDVLSLRFEDVLSLRLEVYLKKLNLNVIIQKNICNIAGDFR